MNSTLSFDEIDYINNRTVENFNRICDRNEKSNSLFSCLFVIMACKIDPDIMWLSNRLFSINSSHKKVKNLNINSSICNSIIQYIRNNKTY